MKDIVLHTPTHLYTHIWLFNWYILSHTKSFKCVRMFTHVTLHIVYFLFSELYMYILLLLGPTCFVVLIVVTTGRWQHRCNFLVGLQFIHSNKISICFIDRLFKKKRCCYVYYPYQRFNLHELLLMFIA